MIIVIDGVKKKRCFRCRQFKRVEDFYRNKTKADKLNSECKICSKNKQKNQYYKDIKKSRVYYREYRRESRQKKIAMLH